MYVKFRFLLALSCLQLVTSVWGVVVDGEKKKEISATRNQSTKDKAIDSYNTNRCGVSDINLKEHEFVNMAREGQFPWMASFQIQLTQERIMSNESRSDMRPRGLNKPRENIHFCGGSFISDKWILSAAHCFSPKTIEKYLKKGRIKAISGSPRVSAQHPLNRNLTIARIYVHANFTQTIPIGYDIALVELSSSVNMTHKLQLDRLNKQNATFINAICLPMKDHSYQKDEVSRVAGWGLSNENDESSMPSKLLTTDIVMRSKEECAESYSKLLKSEVPKKRLEKNDDFLCASYKNTRDTCQSDSGGPLMQYAGGKAVAIGIVSYGIGCAKKGIPGVYTRTSFYTDWIKDITLHSTKATVPFRLIDAGYKDGAVVTASKSKST